MRVINIVKKQDRKRPLKKSTTGLEIEAHVIDNDGNISYRGFDLIKKVKNIYPTIDIVKECGKNMIEVGCYPNIYTYNPAFELITNLEKIATIAKNNNLKLFPFGTYPGKTDSKFTPDQDGRYKIKEKVFGKGKFSLATKAVGFHHHYALPKGVFDEGKKNLKLLIDSKLKRSLLNCYNFEIAIDPILTLFTQSSPFFEGQVLAKDSRMLIYRGGKKLAYPGLYERYQQIGALPPYKQTATDLINSLKKREKRWKELVNKADPKLNFEKLYPCSLDISWNPVKINKHGTLEQRGMDMNYMSIILGVSALIKFCLRKIQMDFIEVLPSDIGINEPFRIKNGVLFIPPHTYVRQKLQKASAYKGFKDNELYNYAKKFYKFARSLTPNYYYPLFKKIDQMFEKKTSVSDEILAFAKRKKLINRSDKISQKSAAVIALYFADKFEKDLEDTKKIVKDIMIQHQKNTNQLKD